jgi:hypothetical protein
MADNKLRPGPHKVTELFDVKNHTELSHIWGIFVGEGCVSGMDPLEWKRIDAHAHSLENDEWQGWICIADPKAVVTPKGRPSHTLLHELAHLILKNVSHGKKWADTVIRLGAKAEAGKYYKPRVKKETVNVVHEEPNAGLNRDFGGTISRILNQGEEPNGI